MVDGSLGFRWTPEDKNNSKLEVAFVNHPGDSLQKRIAEFGIFVPLTPHRTRTSGKFTIAEWDLIRIHL